MAQRTLPLPTTPLALRRPLPVTSVLLIFAAFIAEMAVTLSLGDRVDPYVPVFVATGVALMLLIPTKMGLGLYFLWISVAGLFRIMTRFDPLVHLAADLFLIAIVARWAAMVLAEKRNPLADLPVKRQLIAFVGICLIWMWLPNTNPILALGGLKAYVLPLALLVVGFDVFKKPSEVHRFLVWLALAGAVVSAYGLVQVSQGYYGVLASHPSFAQYVPRMPASLWGEAGTGEIHLRPFSTAVDSGTASAFYVTTAVITVTLLAIGSSRSIPDGISGRLVGMSILPVAIAAVAASAVRSAWFMAAAALMTIFGLSRVRSGLIFLMVIPIGMVAAEYASNAYNSAGFDRRLAAIQDPLGAYSQSRGYAWNVAVQTMLCCPFGSGMGKGVPGTGTIMRITGITSGRGGPSADSLVVAALNETGVPGALALAWLAGSVLWRGVRQYPLLQDGNLRWIDAGITGLLAATLVGGLAGASLFATPGAHYFWMLAGLLLALPKMDREVQASEEGRRLQIVASNARPIRNRNPL